MMPDSPSNQILLCTLNARYIHCSFGLRYLQANLGALESRSQILEFTIQQRTDVIVNQILSMHPKIVGFGVYIWNANQTLAVVQLLKQVRPEILVILGGPEVTHESEVQEIVALADHTIRGEADVLFRQTCERLLAADGPGAARVTLPKIIDGPLPDLHSLKMPYRLFSDEDIKNRVLYVEASRGCAFKCEYCLSSLDLKVRSFALDAFLDEMDQLIQRGARQFKFVDRTFNLSPRVSTQILDFFLKRIHLGLFLHFEMVPDRLPEELRQYIVQFPPGSLQFEVGIQTWNPEVAALVSRKQDTHKVEENLKFLRNHTGVHIHADLIAGLPGETLESFAVGFNRLVSLRPHEVQLGILKRLRGTPIIRHDQEWGMKYAPSPPYEIQQTKVLSAEELQWLKRYSKFWDLVANRGYFKRTLEFIFQENPFQSLSELSHCLWNRFGRTHSIDLMELSEGLFYFLTEVKKQPASETAEALLQDLEIPKARPVPEFLKPYGTWGRSHNAPQRLKTGTPKRQRRFMAENY